MVLAFLKTIFVRRTYAATGSVVRDHLANERTSLAWTRSGLGLVALGIGLERFEVLQQSLAAAEAIKLPPSPTPSLPASSPTASTTSHEPLPPKPPILMPDLLVFSGLGTIAYSTIRYFTVMRLLEQGVFKPSLGAVVCMSGTVGSVGVLFLLDRRNGREPEEQGRKKRV